MYSLIISSILISSTSTLLNRYYSKTINYDSSLILLVVEITKCFIAFSALKFYYKKEISFKDKQNYLVISFLYFLANSILFYLYRNISSGTFVLLAQHRILWIVLLSTYLLDKKYSSEKVIACFINMIGCFLVVFDAIPPNDLPYLFLILIHGLISSMASVYIEKTMKNGDNTLESYFHDSFKLYLFGIPIYALGLCNWFMSNKNIDSVAALPPLQITTQIVSITTMNGLVIGGVYKLLGALERNFIQSTCLVIVVLFDHEKETQFFVIGTMFIMLSIYIFKK